MPGYLQYVYVKPPLTSTYWSLFVPKAWLLVIHLYCYDGMLEGGLEGDS